MMMGACRPLFRKSFVAIILPLFVFVELTCLDLQISVGLLFFVVYFILLCAPSSSS